MGRIKNLKRPELLYLIVTFGWAFSFPLMRNVDGFIDINLFLSLRLLLAFIILSPILILKRKSINMLRTLKGLIMGVFLFAIVSLTFYGVSISKPGNVAFLTGLNVVFVPLMLFAFKKTRINIFNVLSIVAVVFGIFLLSGDLSFTMDWGTIVGVFIGLMSALQIIVNRLLTRNEDEPMLLGIIQIFFAFIFSTILIPLRNVPVEETVFNRHVVIGIVVTAFFSTAIAFTFQAVLQKYTDPIKTSLYFATEPVFTLMLAYVIPKVDGTYDTYSLLELSGLLLIFLGMFLSDDFIKVKLEERKNRFKDD